MVSWSTIEIDYVNIDVCDDDEKERKKNNFCVLKCENSFAFSAWVGTIYLGASLVHGV